MLHIGPLRNGIRSTRGVVRSDVDVKRWMGMDPSTNEVRPARCPNCGIASRPTGGKLALHGHGRRSRQLRGPTCPGGKSETREFRSRRFRCTRCGALLTVVPCETLTKRLYSGPTIALALALFGLSLLPPRVIRTQLSPWAAVGATAAASWCSVGRWVSAARAGTLFSCARRAPEGWTDRQVAERVATTLAAYVPPTVEPPPLAELAFFGAALAR